MWRVGGGGGCVWNYVAGQNGYPSFLSFFSSISVMKSLPSLSLLPPSPPYSSLSLSLPPPLVVGHAPSPFCVYPRQTSSLSPSSQVDSLKMVVGNSAHLKDCRNSFLSCVGKAVSLHNERTSSHENVAERIADLKVWTLDFLHVS